MAENNKSGFRGGDSAINRAGRKRGSRNKICPSKEYERAFQAGLSYTEIIELISEKIKKAKDHKLTENELIKYIAQLLTVKSTVAKEYLQMLKDAEEAQKATEHKEQEKDKTNTMAPVVQFKTKAN